VRHPRSAAACPEIARIRTVRDQSALLDFQHGIYPVKSARIERNAMSRVMRRSVHRKTIVKKK
jgi:hypothetical protein